MKREKAHYDHFLSWFIRTRSKRENPLKKVLAGLISIRAKNLLNESSFVTETEKKNTDFISTFMRSLTSFSWIWTSFSASQTESGAEMLTERELSPLFWIKSKRSGDSEEMQPSLHSDC